MAVRVDLRTERS